MHFLGLGDEIFHQTIFKVIYLCSVLSPTLETKAMGLYKKRCTFRAR